MATWVRTGTGTAPSATDADLTGAVTLGNATAPGDFDPNGVTNINIAWRLTIAGLSDDDWTDNRMARLRTAGSVELGSVDLANTLRTANGNYDSSGNDATPTSGQTVSAWEGATIDSGPVVWAIWNKTKGGDGTTASIPVANVVVTITYTPAAATATPAVIPTTVNVLAVTAAAAANVAPAVVALIADVLAVTTAITNPPVVVTPATIAATADVLAVTTATSGPAVIEVDAWRIYEDGAEASSTALGVANNQGAVVPFDTPFLVRFLVKNTGGNSATFQPKLQTRYMPPGTGGTIDWEPNRGLPSSPTEITFADMIDLTATSTHANAVASGTISDNAATTQRLGSGTFVAGKVDTGDGAFASSWSIPAGQETEVVFCVELDSTDFATVDDKNNQYEVQFRIVDDIGEALYDTYRNGTSALGEVFARVNPPWTWENDLEAGTSGNSLSTADANSPDGWDAINEGAGATIEYFNSDPWEGSLHGIIDDSSGSNLCRIRWHDINQGVATFFRVYIKPISNGTQIINFLYATGGYNDGDETLWNVDYNTDRTLTLQDKNGTTIGSTAALSNSPTDYYRLEIGWRPESGIDVGDGFIEMRLFVGDSTTATSTVTDSTALVGTEFEDLDFGPRRAADTMVMYFDAIAFSNDDWVGPLSTAVTATPATIALATSVLAPTVSVPVTVIPATITATASVLAPTAQAQATVTPATIATTVDVLAPTESAATTVTPATIPTTASVLAPTAQAATNVVPATIALAVDVLAVTAGVPATTTPATIPTSATVLAPTVLAATNVAPATIAAVADVLLPTAQAAASSSPATIAMVADALAPTVVLGGVNANPATIAATADILSVVAQAATTVSPAVVALTADVLSPVAQAAATVIPSVIVTTADVLPVTVELGGVVAFPAVVAATTDVFAVSVGAAATVTPATIAAVADVLLPAALVGDLIVQPALITATADVLAVTAIGNANVSPALIALAVNVLSVVASAGGTVSVAAISLVADVLAVTAQAATNAAPAAITTTADVLAPVASVPADPTPATIPMTVTVLPPTIDTGGETVQPGVIGMTINVLPPSLSAATLVTPATIPMVVTFLSFSAFTGIDIPNAPGDTRDENALARGRNASLRGSTARNSGRGGTQRSTGKHGTTEYNPS